MTDQEHLIAIRAAAKTLADRLNEAVNDGLNVECSVTSAVQWAVMPFFKCGWSIVTNAWRTIIVEEPNPEATSKSTLEAIA